MSDTARVLICSPVMPAYDRESGSKRIFDLVEFFRDAGWAVSFAARSRSGDERYVRLLRQRGIAVYPELEGVEQVISDGSFDLVVVAFWHLAESLLPAIRASSPGTRVIVDSIDLHFVRASRGAFLEPYGRLDANYASQMAREINAYAAADGVMTVSQKEADLINDLVGDPTLAHTVPDGEDLLPSQVPFAERKGILFIGNFWHPPNVEAVRYLCAEIVPRLDPAVLAEHPIHVVGNGLNDTVRGYGAGSEHVRMVGWVPSVLPYLEHARISIVPLLHGAGTKRKLIQALMIGTPTVSTSIGVEGLDLRDGEHVLVADDPAGFAESAVRLVQDAELWERVARQGRAHITAPHGREAARTRLLKTVSAVLAKEDRTIIRHAGYDSGPVTVDGLPAVAEGHGSAMQKLREHNQRLQQRNESWKAYGRKLERELHAIKGSRTWRMLGLYRRLRALPRRAKKSG